MVRKYLHAILIVLIFSVGCKQDYSFKGINQFKRSDFKESLSLTGTSFNLPGVFRPLRIQIIPEKNICIVLEAQRAGYFANVYSLDSMKFIKSFIRNARIPIGQISATSMQYVPNHRKLYVFDPLQQNIFSYSIDSIADPLVETKPNGFLGDTSNRYNGNIAVSKIMSPIVIPASHKIAGRRFNMQGEPLRLLNFYDYKLSLSGSMGLYPDTLLGLPPFAYDEVYFGGLHISLKGDKLIFNYYNTDIISIYDTAGRLLVSKQGPDALSHKMKLFKTDKGVSIVPLKDARFGYLSPVKASGNRIMILYNGKKVSKRDESSGELFVFNDSLQPQTRYLLSENIFDFDIDWQSHRIYGLTNVNSPRVVVFAF